MTHPALRLVATGRRFPAEPDYAVVRSTCCSAPLVRTTRWREIDDADGHRAVVVDELHTCGACRKRSKAEVSR